MVVIDKAISWSRAPITGAVAAMAEPPQIAVPTPISTGTAPLSRSSRLSPHAVRKAIASVTKVSGSDANPVFATADSDSPNPSMTTEARSKGPCANLMPGRYRGWVMPAALTARPSKSAETAPPTTGTQAPNSIAGATTSATSNSPLERERHSGSMAEVLGRAVLLTAFMGMQGFGIPQSLGCDMNK